MTRSVGVIALGLAIVFSFAVVRPAGGDSFEERPGRAAARQTDEVESARELEKARELLGEGRAEEARAVLESYLKQNPQSVAAWKVMGEALRKLDENEEALFAYRRAAELSRDDVESLFWIGTLSRWLGEWAESLNAFSSALERSPNDTGSLLGRARALMHMGTYDQAERDLRHALERSPDNAEAASLLADVLGRQNRLDAARAELEKVVEPAELHKEMGDLYREKELYGEAIERYRAALSIRPDEAAWRRSLADALREDRDFAGALEEYCRLADANPDDAGAHFWAATLLRWRGADEEAEKAYLAALVADPSHSGAMTGLVRVLRKQGRREEALDWARRAVEASPGSAEAHTVLGSELAHAGHAREAVRHLERALELSPGDREATQELLNARRRGFQSVEATYRLSDAQALEGRERGLGADPFPIPMEYQSDEYILSYEMPGPRGRIIGAEAGLSYDKLENLRFDRTVYDVRSLTVRAKAAHSLGRAGRLEGSAGARHFTDIGGGRDLEEETYEVYDVRWDIRGPSDELTLKAGRAQVLVRGAAENTYFGIVRVSGYGAAHRRTLNDYVSYRTSYSFSEYSDGNATHYLSTGPDIRWRRNTFSPRLRYWPLQRYDLDDRDRLQFVRITSVGSSYRAYFGSGWRASAGYWHSWYEDDQGDKNKAHTWAGKVIYHPRWSGPGFIGFETEGTLFSLPLGSRRGYISYDTESWAALAGLEKEWAQGMLRLSLGRSWEKDEIAEWHNSFLALGYLESWLGTSTKLSVDGRFYRNDLDDFYGPGKEEKVQRYYVCLRRLF